MPPHPDALIAFEKTGVRRYLAKCDPDHPDYDPAYLTVVARIARGEPLSSESQIGYSKTRIDSPPASHQRGDWTRYSAPSRAMKSLVESCLYRERPACGCSAAVCHAGRGDRWNHTTLENCVSCLSPKALTLRAYLTSWTGYGGIAKHLGRGLDANGYGHFKYIDIHTQDMYLGRDPWVEARIGPRPEPGTSILQLAVPHTHVPRNYPTVVFTMWESSRIEPRTADVLNHAKAVIVPCEYNRAGFLASGVKVPIHVVPLGVDPDEGFTPKPRLEGKPFTFGMSARMAHGGIRKGVNEGMRAFVKAFPNGEDVRLEVKVFEDCVPQLRIPDDPRIVVITEALDARRMSEWFGGIDVLFVPSKGEGWGLNTHQAMACGRPVIAAVYSGTAEFFDGRFGWELPFTEEPAGEFYAPAGGSWCVPTEDGMIEALRAAEQTPDQTLWKIGGAAAVRAREFTWDRNGRELVRVLESTDGFLGPKKNRVPRVPTVGCSFVVGRMDCLPEAVRSVLPYVDELYALVDSRAPREVFEYLEKQGIRHDVHYWTDDFSEAYNLAHSRLGTDWGLHLDTDEVLDDASGPLLRKIAAEGEAAGLDAFGSPRRHWLDKDMRHESDRFKDDRQVKLRRKGFRFAGRVHQQPAPGQKARLGGPVVHHFNLALESDAGLEAKSSYYDRIASA